MALKKTKDIFRRVTSAGMKFQTVDPTIIWNALHLCGKIQKLANQFK